MARAGWCTQCGKNVWLNAEGGCSEAGHPVESVTGVYETTPPPPPSTAPVAAAAPPAPPAPQQYAAPQAAQPVSPAPRKRGKVLLIVGLLLALPACCVIAGLLFFLPVRTSIKEVQNSAEKAAKRDAASPAAAVRKGPKNVEELKAYMQSNHGSQPWYPAIADIRYVSRFGYPVCQVLIADGGDRSFDPTHEKDAAILNAIEEAQIGFANNLETIGVKGVRSSTNEDPWEGLARPKPLADIPAPADLEQLKPWIDAQYGPQGPNPPVPADAHWYQVFKSAQWSMKGNDRIEVRTSVAHDWQGGQVEEELMYAVSLAKPSFAKEFVFFYGDGYNDVDFTQYEIPWK